MIFGCYSPVGTEGVAAAAPLPDMAGDEDIVVVPVEKGRFRGGCLLHRRLPHSASDFLYEEEGRGLLVLIWGAIYNKKELVEEYGAGTSVTIPALIAQLFKREGSAFVGRLNGDFAIFISDEEKGEVWLFRDHLGIRPLVFSIEGGRLLFSTDMISLCRTVSGGKALEKEWFTGYFRYSDRKKTASPEVHKLLPGHYLRYGAEGFGEERYWFPEKVRPDRTTDTGTFIQDVSVAVTDAVACRCDSRYTAAAHLSGGLDSSVVAALAARQYPRQQEFTGYSWSPLHCSKGDAACDERELAGLMADHAGMKAVFSDMDKETFIRYAGDYIFNQGFFPEHHTLVQAREAGVNLIFSGWGGDEFISTSHRGVDTDLLRYMKPGMFFRRNPLRRLRSFARTLLYDVLMPLLGITEREVTAALREESRYLKRQYRKSPRRQIALFHYYRSRRHMHLRMLDFYHLQERCEAWAVMGYRMGVEYRYPLLDRRIVELMLVLPSEVLAVMAEHRPVLCRAFADLLPEAVLKSTGKSDPVYWRWMEALQREAGQAFAGEVDDWKEAGFMDFVDFEGLERDIRAVAAGSGKVNERVLYRAMVYLKGVYEAGRALSFTEHG